MAAPLRLALATLLLAAAPGAAQAGSACGSRQVTLDQITHATALALAVKAQLDLRPETEAALIGRIGADLSDQGLKYSHMGAVLRDHPKGRWLFRHMLNHCGTAESALYDEGLLNFFLDDMHRYEALILVPVPAVQARLAAALRGPQARSFYDPRYNMIAHPFAGQYQNSNQWLLELTAASAAPAGLVRDRAGAIAWLKLSGFQPDQVTISPFRRLGARLAAANVAFDDHHDEEFNTDRFHVVTVRSIDRWLAQQNLLGERLEVGIDGQAVSHPY